MRFTIFDWKIKGLWLAPLLLVLVLSLSRSAWAQVDLAGQWSPRVYNDGRDIGDYTGIPLNAAGRMRAETFSPEQVDLPENVCRPHPADMGLRVAPSQMYISEDFDNITRKVLAYHLHTPWSEQTVWMDGRPHPPDYAFSDWSGFSTGHWEDDTLVYTTDHLKDAYLTRTGVPRSSKATITTRINRFGTYLTISIIINDPAYLTEPYIRESSWVYAPHQVIPPGPCEIPPEGSLVPAGRVPSNMPGHYPYISEFAVEYGLPLEAALGGAETMYPEYIRKMKTMKTEPRTTSKHYRRFG